MSSSRPQIQRRPVVAAAAQGHLESITDGETGLLVTAGDVDCARRWGPEVDHRSGAGSSAGRARPRSRPYADFSVERYRREVADLVERLGHRRPTM